jgi:STE24 endopeptidase
MTAIRTARFWGIALGAGLWLAVAAFLWRTDVPDLVVPEVDPRAVFGERHVERSARYERFLRGNWLAATVVELAVLVAVALLAPRLRLRRLVHGVAVAAATFAVLFVAALPFGLAAHWWRRRYGVSAADYSTILLDPWLERIGSLVAACGAVALFMLLARRLGERWWLVGGPAFALVAAALLLAQLLLLTPRLEPLRDPRLAAEIRQLARAQGVGEIDVEVKDASRRTRALNAEFYGVGPSQRIVLWDTALDGRLTRAQIRTLAAHELGHVEARHLWKGVAWLVLFAIPCAYVVARATRRRGGLGEPAAVPVALLTLAVLQLALLPVENAISRRYEREADWLALRATRDPRALEGLTRELARASVAQPDPPRWARLVLETHPTPRERIAMARSEEAPPGGS